MMGCPADSPSTDPFGGGTAMESAGVPSVDDGDTGSAESTGDTGADSGDSTGDAETGVEVGCGNGVVDGTETCDGTDLAGETCEGLGFEIGVLACTDNCGGFDLEGCGFFECGNGKAEGDEDCDGTVGAATCLDAGFDNGTLFCTTDCEYNTDQCGMCGDEILDAEEDCEPTLPLRAACDDLMFESGEVSCAKDCTYDTSGCQLCGNDTVEGDEPCDGTDLGGETCANLGLEGGDLGCIDCAFDFTSCDVMVPPIPACADGDLGFDVGPLVATGTTVGQDDDVSQSCAVPESADFVYRWIALAAGSYTIDTFGSGYDTALTLHQTDCTTEISCNDDSGVGLQSSVNFNAAAGQEILIGVQGFFGATGNFSLNITAL